MSIGSIDELRFLRGSSYTHSLSRAYLCVSEAFLVFFVAGHTYNQSLGEFFGINNANNNYFVTESNEDNVIQISATVLSSPAVAHDANVRNVKIYAFPFDFQLYFDLLFRSETIGVDPENCIARVHDVLDARKNIKKKYYYA